MTGSPSAIVSLGLGSWSSAGLLLTLGYGQGEEAAVAYYPPQACLSRSHIRTAHIQRQNAATKGLRRIHVGTEELDSNG